MGKNTSVMLTDHFIDFIEEKVRQGRFASASEAVRAGLRLLEIEEQEYDRIRDALRQGEASGAPAPFDWDDFMTEVRATAS
jgi:antitoxin ParD1/3/4